MFLKERDPSTTVASYRNERFDHMISIQGEGDFQKRISQIFRDQRADGIRMGHLALAVVAATFAVFFIQTKSGENKQA